MFTTYPTYYRYRTLKLTATPYTRGEDVYALQTGLVSLGFNVGDAGADGIFGKDTDTAVRAFQASRGLVVDGICGAGGETQRRIGVDIITRKTDTYGLLPKLLYGQVQHECSFILGNYSLLYSDGSWDSGAAQENSHVYSVQRGFTTNLAIDDCGRYCRTYFDKFAGVDTTRRWALAAGAWNVPAYACYIANEEGASVPSSECKKPTDAQRQALENYIDSVTAYV